SPRAVSSPGSRTSSPPRLCDPRLRLILGVVGVVGCDKRSAVAPGPCRQRRDCASLVTPYEVVSMQTTRRLPLSVAIALVPSASFAQDDLAAYIRENYERRDFKIPMRDGVRLYTVVYSPKTSELYPILMRRTPYGVGPYDKTKFPGTLGPNKHFPKEGYIFVSQDVRGCYMSEGTFENMRPHLAKRTSNKDIDESTDTYDTIDWLIKHLPNHNGKVGF